MINPDLMELTRDVLLWSFFFLGQCMWVLKCAAAAVRSKINPFKTRRAFIAANWDIFIIRMSLGLIPFWIVRHVSLRDAAGWFGWMLPSWFPTGGSGNILLFFCLGLAADVAIDSLAQWGRLPASIRAKLKEEIPTLPHPVVESTTKTTVEGTDVKTETTTEVKNEGGK